VRPPGTPSAAGGDPTPDGPDAPRPGGDGRPRLPGRPRVILEDVDVIEERRQRHRRKGLPPELEGSPEDPKLWRRMAAYARPFTLPLLLAVVLSFVAMAAKVAYLFVLKGLLQPFFETQMQVDAAEVLGAGGVGAGGAGVASELEGVVVDGVCVDGGAGEAEDAVDEGGQGGKEAGHGGVIGRGGGVP